MKKIHIHHHSFSHSEIKALPHGAGHNEAITLAHAWLTGRGSFAFKTSGSTGIPKEIVFSRNQILSSIARTTTALKLTAKDHFLCCLSMQTVGGAMMLLRALELNAEITILGPSSEPLDQINLLHPFTCASFVPLQLHSLADYPDRLEKLNRLNVILVGGAAINKQLNYALIKLKTQVFQTYGMTETLSHVALRRVGKEDVFHVLPGIETKTDENQCLCVKADVTNNQWIATHDVVQFADKNSFVLLGRADQVINTGGVKVFPDRVETVLGPIIKEKNFFVAGIPNEKLGEQVTLFIEGSSSIELKKLKEAVGKSLGEYEIPRQITLVKSFMKTPSGKVDRLKTIHSV